MGPPSGGLLNLFDMSPSFESFLTFWHEMFQTHFVLFLFQLWNHASSQGILISSSRGDIWKLRFLCLMCSLMCWSIITSRVDIGRKCMHTQTPEFVSIFNYIYLYFTFIFVFYIDISIPIQHPRVLSSLPLSVFVNPFTQ